MCVCVCARALCVCLRPCVSTLLNVLVLVLTPGLRVSPQGLIEADSETLFELAAYVLQAQHGDYSESVLKQYSQTDSQNEVSLNVGNSMKFHVLTSSVGFSTACIWQCTYDFVCVRVQFTFSSVLLLQRRFGAKAAEEASSITNKCTQGTPIHIILVSESGRCADKWTLFSGTGERVLSTGARDGGIATGAAAQAEQRRSPEMDALHIAPLPSASVTLSECHPTGRSITRVSQRKNQSVGENWRCAQHVAALPAVSLRKDARRAVRFHAT